MTRHRAIAALAVLALLTAPFTATSAADPGQSAACADGEPRTDLVACRAEEGHHEGTLTQHVNEQDNYELEPSEELVRIEIEAEGRIVAWLVDPSGTVRDVGENLFGPIELTSVVTDPGGTWTLTIAREHGAMSFGYAFDLADEHHDHVASVGTEPEATATTLTSFANVSFAHVEIQLTVPDHLLGEPLVLFQLLNLTFPDGGSFWLGSILQGYGGIQPTTDAWSEGTLPEDVKLSLPDVRTGQSPMTLSFEADHGFALAYGQSLSTGYDGFQARAVWDGAPDGNLSVQSDGAATFDELEDFQAGSDGSGIQVGPYAHADNLTTTYESAQDRSTLATVNPFTPSQAVEPAHFRVTEPGGEVHDLRGGSPVAWWPTQASAGTWQADAVHVDGFEGDTIRFAAASFPFQVG